MLATSEMNIARVSTILNECIGCADEDGITSLGVETVDVWMMVSLKTNKVHEYKQEMIKLLKHWPSDDSRQSVPSLGDKISYLQVSELLGSQKFAFLLFAFGKMLNWWTVIDPRSFGFSKDESYAHELFGMGFVSIKGYKPGGIAA